MMFDAIKCNNLHLFFRLRAVNFHPRAVMVILRQHLRIANYVEAP